jgi:glycosyltransferase involved in cell wall biosynthesis
MQGPRLARSHCNQELAAKWRCLGNRVKKPAILFVGASYVLAIHRKKLAALADQFEVTCATSDQIDQQGYGWPTEGSSFGRQEEPVDVRRFSEWPKGAKRTRFIYRRLGRLFREKQFDFVIADSEPWGFVKWQTWVLTRTTQRGALFGEFTAENVKRSGLKGLILSLIYKVAMRVDDFTIALNQSCRRILIEYGAKPELNLVAAQFGIDPAQFAPVDQTTKANLRTTLGLRSEAFVIGYCGRFVREKGLLKIVEAVDAIRERLGDRKVHLAFLGTGPLEKDLRVLSGDRPWFHLLKARPPEQIPVFMQAIDLFILASEPVNEAGRVNEEQFGLVLIEAMACGILAIGSTCGAIPEVIGDDRAVFPHSSSAAIAATLDAFIQDPGLSQSVAEGQYNRVLERYTYEAVARTYADFVFRVQGILEWRRLQRPGS